MKLVKKRNFSAKYVALSGMLILVMSALLMATPNPAKAGTSFSIGFGTGGSGIVYRSWSGGGYRHYHRGWWGAHHRWHAGYFYGPVVWSPSGQYYGGGPRYYHHFRDRNDWHGDDHRNGDRHGDDHRGGSHH
jgi:hypothetical protein